MSCYDGIIFLKNERQKEKKKDLIPFCLVYDGPYLKEKEI